jgi:hypothetical protein
MACVLLPAVAYPTVWRNTYTCSRTVRVSSSIYPMSQQHWDDVHPTSPLSSCDCEETKAKKATARQLAVAVVAEPSTGRFSLLVYGTDGRARAACLAPLSSGAASNSSKIQRSMLPAAGRYMHRSVLHESVELQPAEAEQMMNE